MENLFDSIQRTHLEPAKHNENTYNYYNISARADIAKVRHTLEDWFLNYPKEERKELKSRFKKDFNSSFYELFLYQLFYKLGFKIDIHPDLPSSLKKPDFLIFKDDLEIYIEAKIVKYKTKKQEAFERKMNEFYDNLNNIKSDNFMLWIESINILCENQPSTKGIIRYIEDELKKLNPDRLDEEVNISGFQKLPFIEYNNGDIHIIVKPLLVPVKPSARKKINRPISVFPPEYPDIGSEGKHLKKSVRDKAKRYGKLDKPFIVCMNSLSPIPSKKEDIDNVIWGSDGVFINKKDSLENLTGILVTQVYPHNISNANCWLYEHTFSENKMDFNKLGLKFNVKMDKNVIESTGEDIGDILGISKDWLVEDNHL